MSAANLFPIPHFLAAFTTSPAIHLPNLAHVLLSDAALGVHRVSSRTSHALVAPPPVPADPAALPPPALAWEASYPKGSINPTAPLPGGFGFYLSGPPAFADKLADAREVVFSYRVLLEDDWAWGKGGKLPGVCRWFYCARSVRADAEVVQSAGRGRRRISVRAGGRTSGASVSIFVSCGG